MKVLPTNFEQLQYKENMAIVKNKTMVKTVLVTDDLGNHNKI